MLPENNRLRSDNDFKKVFRSGRALENQFFRVKFLKNYKNKNRFGFVVSNKLSKKATVRNTIKRRLRSSCRPLTENLEDSFDIVIWPKAESVKLRYKDFSRSLWELINEKIN